MISVKKQLTSVLQLVKTIYSFKQYQKHQSVPHSLQSIAGGFYNPG